ncbi:hypothetical protein AAG570_006668 [Ranatra chinensis]|uniref:Uncharacterized protein n=1 Tax=Ranatra chinensis TaxID=642074 RepID=A0ABD0YUZ6_9HEMI
MEGMSCARRGGGIGGGGLQVSSHMWLTQLTWLFIAAASSVLAAPPKIPPQDIKSQKDGKLHVPISVVSCFLFWYYMFRRLDAIFSLSDWVITVQLVQRGDPVVLAHTTLVGRAKEAVMSAFLRAEKDGVSTSRRISAMAQKTGRRVLATVAWKRKEVTSAVKELVETALSASVRTPSCVRGSETSAARGGLESSWKKEAGPCLRKHKRSLETVETELTETLLDFRRHAAGAMAALDKCWARQTSTPPDKQCLSRVQTEVTAALAALPYYNVHHLVKAKTIFKHSLKSIEECLSKFQEKMSEVLKLTAQIKTC